jgi:muramoyltetrapeptide carboxypeptidase
MNSSEPLIRPWRLEQGAHLAVLSISGPADGTRIQAAVENLRGRGFRVTLCDGSLARGPREYLAGDDASRAARLNEALSDPSFDAFLFTRGGYGAMRILDAVDYDRIQQRPRPVIGYSDLTALHQAVAAKARVTTFHGPMLNTDFHDGLSRDIEDWMWSMLAGEAPLTFRLAPDNVLADGSADGILFGGCLALTTALVGTPFDYWPDDGIWFWEDVGEPLYRIDRMLTHLRLSGRFQRLRGMIVGELRECGEGRSDELDSLLSEFVKPLGIPVVRGLPFGHFGNNLMLPIGQRIALDTTTLELTVPEAVVQSGDA